MGGRRRLNYQSIIFVAIIIIVLYAFYRIQREEEWHRQFQYKITEFLKTHVQDNSTKSDKGKLNSTAYRIGIVQVVGSNLFTYETARNSVQCYSTAQNYEFHSLTDDRRQKYCSHNDKFFRRHCLVAHFLKKYKNLDYVLFIDSDIGVINPKRRIEEFIDPLVEITFIDRFYNWEVGGATYLMRNSKWTQNFLHGYADYEFRLPNSFHGTDNGAIHAYLAELILPPQHTDIPICLQIYNQSTGFSDLFLFEACIRNALGNNITFGNIKILRKGTGWVRDNWLTNSRWNEERDFMMHCWKNNQLRNYSTHPIPLSAKSSSQWYYPFIGQFELSLCTFGNTSWSYDRNLISTRQDIDGRLREFAKEVNKEREKSNNKLKHYFNITRD